MKFYLNGSEIECSPDEYKRLIDLGVINNGGSNADNKGVLKNQPYLGPQSLEDWLKEGQRGVVAVYGCQLPDHICYDQKFTCDTKTVSNPGQSLMINNGTTSVLATDKCDTDESTDKCDTDESTDKCDTDESTEQSDTVVNEPTDNVSNNIPLPPIDMSTIRDKSTICGGALYVVKDADVDKYVAIHGLNNDTYLSCIKLDAARFIDEQSAMNYANLATKVTGNNFVVDKFIYGW